MLNALTATASVAVAIVAVVAAATWRILLLRWQIARTLRACREYDALYRGRCEAARVRTQLEGRPEGREAA